MVVTSGACLSVRRSRNRGPGGRARPNNIAHRISGGVTRRRDPTAACPRRARRRAPSAGRTCRSWSWADGPVVPGHVTSGRGESSMQNRRIGGRVRAWGSGAGALFDAGAAEARARAKAHQFWGVGGGRSDKTLKSSISSDIKRGRRNRALTKTGAFSRPDSPIPQPKVNALARDSRVL